MPDKMPVYDLPCPDPQACTRGNTAGVWFLPVRLQLPIRFPGRSPGRPSAGTRWAGGSQPLSQPTGANQAGTAEFCEEAKGLCPSDSFLLYLYCTFESHLPDTPKSFGMYGGDDGARTRDLCRDS
jgi:hypothetical protein